MQLMLLYILVLQQQHLVLTSPSCSAGQISQKAPLFKPATSVYLIPNPRLLIL